MSDFEGIFTTVFKYSDGVELQIAHSPTELDAQGFSCFSQLLKPNSHRRFESCSLYRDTISSTVPPQVLLSGLSMCFICQCFGWIGVVVT